MKISMPCPTCRDVALNAVNDDEDPIFVVDANLSDVLNDQVHDRECKQGHPYRTYLKNEKFEILFDMGALAFLDGYHREAVATWAASLERCLEFHTKILWRKAGLGLPQMDRAWSQIAKQSERQFGAFVSAYLMDAKDAPPPIHECKMETWGKKPLVSFRNQVIHEGYIPTREQALEYGTIALDYMFGRLRELLPRDGQHALWYLQQKEFAARGDAPDAMRCIGRLIETIVGLWLWNDPRFGTATLQQALEHLSSVRDLRYPKQGGEYLVRALKPLEEGK